MLTAERPWCYPLTLGMRRRDFIALFGSVVVVRVSAADAQTITKSYQLAGVFPGGVMDFCIWLIVAGPELSPSPTTRGSLGNLS